MRFMEIANPEDQLALWRLISDNVWSAVMAQANQAAALKAQAAAIPKPKKFKPKKAIPKAPPAPKPKPPAPKRPPAKSPVPPQPRSVAPSRPSPLPSSQPVLRPTRKLPQIENNMKIEASISLRRRDEEVKVHGEPDCWNLG